MTDDEIKIGRVYTATVSGKVVQVRVDSMRQDVWWDSRKRVVARYVVTNLVSDRTMVFKTARRFHWEVVGHDGLTDRERKYVSKGE